MPAPYHAAPLPAGAELRVYAADKYAETVWPDGLRCGATREENDQNLAEVASQGYSRDAAGLWLSLLHHEIGHNVCAADIWPDRLSAALRHEAGDSRPYWARLHEEAVVLGVQVYMNTGVLVAPLLAYASLVPGWVERLRDVRRCVAMGVA